MWDLNKPAPEEVGRDYHLVLASNVLHTAANMAGAIPCSVDHSATGYIPYDSECLHCEGHIDGQTSMTYTSSRAYSELSLQCLF